MAFCPLPVRERDSSKASSKVSIEGGTASYHPPVQRETETETHHARVRAREHTHNVEERETTGLEYVFGDARWRGSVKEVCVSVCEREGGRERIHGCIHTDVCMYVGDNVHELSDMLPYRQGQGKDADTRIQHARQSAQIHAHIDITDFLYACITVTLSWTAKGVPFRPFILLKRK